MSELVKRILTAAVGIPVFIYSIHLGEWYFTILLTLMTVGGIHEFYNMASSKGFHPSKRIGLLISILIPLSFYYSLANSHVELSFLSLVLILIGGSIAIMLNELWSGNKHALINISTSLSGILYIPVFFLSLLLIRNFNLLFSFIDKIIYNDTQAVFIERLGFIPDYAMFEYIVYILFIGVWVCDSSAYFGGMTMGKHKLFERVSPKKTWEGAVWGFAGAIVSTMLLSHFLLDSILIIHSIVIGILIGTAGQIGDLAESLLKRDAGVKDSSNLIPGHGGILDRFDSVLFVFPLVFLYLTFLLIF